MDDPTTYTAQDLKRDLALSSAQLDDLLTYVDLLRRWQKKINLISPATIPLIWYRHILDSAQLYPLLDDGDQTIGDLGSGAGFPGLVLAILSGRPTTLIESDQRKSAFLREAIRATKAPAQVMTKRIEQIEGETFDLITSRALAPLPDLLTYAAPLVSPGGKCLFLKGQSLDDELTASDKDWKMRVTKVPSRSSDQGFILKLEGLERCS